MRMKLTFDRSATALRALIEAYAERTGTEFQEIKITIDGLDPSLTQLVCSTVHDGMKVIGLMADEGDDSLIQASRIRDR